MNTARLSRNACLAVVAGLSLLVVAPAWADSAAAKIRAIDRMMATMGRESARDAADIRRLYQPYLQPLLLTRHADLEGALATGGLVALPSNLRSFNLAPRVEGPHPIGEKDLGNQASYIAARPATIGALIAVASRVRSGPIEITSLVRHAEYQTALRATNGNATTSVPMHTMGLAFDIALLNTPMAHVKEIRDVLQEMRASGDILFIGERQQLVFHVVPHPSRLGYFNDVYARAVGTVSTAQSVEVIAPGPPQPAVQRLVPRVVAEVVAVRPSADHWHEWNAALRSDADARDVAIEAAASPPGVSMPIAATVLLRGLLAFVAALCTTAWRIAHS